MKIDCTCPPGRPLGMDHLPGCPAWEYEAGEGTDVVPDDASVLAMRDETGAPVVIPAAIAREFDQMYRAFEMKQRGKSWEHIASVEGYPTTAAPSGQALAAAVRRYLEDGQRILGEFKKKEFLALLVARAEAVTDAVWDEAMKGKPASVMALLAAQDRIAKWTGTEEPDRGEQGMATTVVVRHEHYVNDLKSQAPPIAAVEPEEDDGDIEEAEVVEPSPDATP